MSKLDLLNSEAKTKLERYLEPDMSAVLSEEMSDDDQMATRFHKLNQVLATLVRLCHYFCIVQLTYYVVHLLSCAAVFT